jgi:hypothetical protein
MCSSNGFLRSLFSPLSGRDVKGALQVSEKRSTAVILSPFAVILSAAKNLALPAQGKLREGSRSEYFQGNARFFLRDAQDRLRLLRMTVPASFSAACKAPTFPIRGEKSRLTNPDHVGHFGELNLRS